VSSTLVSVTDETITSAAGENKYVTNLNGFNSDVLSTSLHQKYWIYVTYDKHVMSQSQTYMDSISAEQVAAHSSVDTSA